MPRPPDACVTALSGWLVEDARERLARARGAADASTPEAVLERHRALRGPRMRELVEETRERGLLSPTELADVARWLRAAYAAVGHARADRRRAEVFVRRVPYDSDHHTARWLVERLGLEPHPVRRRAMGRALEAFAAELGRALRQGLADVEEALEPARWVEALTASSLEAAEPLRTDRARAALVATDEAWSELLERCAHAAATPMETWTDLLYALRARRFDSLVPPRGRYRRLADAHAPWGVVEALSRRARVEVGHTLSHRPAVVALSVPRDVRIVPAGLELGLLSEREALLALGRALSVAWTHPALPALRAWPRGACFPRVLGGLFAHWRSDPAFEPTGGAAPGLSTAERRALREAHLAHELWSLRTAAACALAGAELEGAGFVERARGILGGAWRVEVDPHVAEVLCMPPGFEPEESLRAMLWVGPLHRALRERFDEDLWRNPRASEVLRAAAERGPGLLVDAWAAELGADANALGARYAELLR